MTVSTADWKAEFAQAVGIDPKTIEQEIRKPKRTRLPKGEAMKMIGPAIYSVLATYPGLKPRAVTAILEADGYLDWLPRSFETSAVVSGVLRDLAKATKLGPEHLRVVAAGGWWLWKDIPANALSDHKTTQAKRGLRTGTNAVRDARDGGVISEMPKAIKDAAKAVDYHLP